MTAGRIPLRVSSLVAARPSSGRMQRGGVVQLGPFLTLARELAGLLAPVRPREAFRSELERRLLVAARQQNAQMSLHAYPEADGVTPRRFEGVGSRVVIGAAAVGSAVSLVGLVAYMLHRRGERTAWAGEVSDMEEDEWARSM